MLRPLDENLGGRVVEGGPALEDVAGNEGVPCVVLGGVDAASSECGCALAERGEDGEWNHDTEGASAWALEGLGQEEEEEGEQPEPVAAGADRSVVPVGGARGGERNERDRREQPGRARTLLGRRPSPRKAHEGQDEGERQCQRHVREEAQIRIDEELESAEGGYVAPAVSAG